MDDQLRKPMKFLKIVKDSEGDAISVFSKENSPTPTTKSCYLRNPFQLALKIRSTSPEEETQQDEDFEGPDSIEGSLQDDHDASSLFSHSNHVFE